MKPKQIDALAQRIARDLFTNGSGVRADHLKLMLRGYYLGGWSEGAMADRIAKTLGRSAFIKPTTPKTKRSNL